MKFIHLLLQANKYCKISVCTRIIATATCGSLVAMELVIHTSSALIAIMLNTIFTFFPALICHMYKIISNQSVVLPTLSTGLTFFHVWLVSAPAIFEKVFIQTNIPALFRSNNVPQQTQSTKEARYEDAITCNFSDEGEMRQAVARIVGYRLRASTVLYK